MKENKDYQIKCRLTASQKEAVAAYSAAHSLTISEVIRLAITELLKREV